MKAIANIISNFAWGVEKWERLRAAIGRYCEENRGREAPVPFFMGLGIHRPKKGSRQCESSWSISF